MYDIRLRDNDSSGGCGLYSWPLTLNGMTNYLNVSINSITFLYKFN